jgi:LmbE family N-acetylglucosaminyl deacetylase
MNFRKLGRRSRAALGLYLRLHHHEDDRPQVLHELPAAKRVVVLAPHPDDETIGCGGTLHLYASRGTSVTVIYCTDGARGGLRSSGLSKDEKRAARERHIETRKREAREAAGLLGISDLVFLGEPDGDLRPTPAAADALRAELKRLRPDVVFLPFLLDQHTDHFQTNALFLRAAESLYSSGGPECWAYEIWTPLYANRLVDITAAADVKWAALGRYESQLKSLDYVTTTRGLNAYRWMFTYRGSGFAEAFFACSLDRYRELFREVGQPSAAMPAHPT